MKIDRRLAFIGITNKITVRLQPAYYMHRKRKETRDKAIQIAPELPYLISNYLRQLFLLSKCSSVNVVTYNNLNNLVFKNTFG